jgi:hypothetical protein
MDELLDFQIFVSKAFVLVFLVEFPLSCSESYVLRVCEMEAKDLPYLLIKQKRMSSLLMENRAKTITKPLSGVHKKPHSNLPKTVSSRQRTSVIVITSP